MNKLSFITALVCLLYAFPLRSQNVILSEDFEGDISGYIISGLPTGHDQTWINADFDGIPDASTLGRPDNWWVEAGFADADAGTMIMASNSWTYSPTPVANYLILPPIHFNDGSGMLYWKSAPYQTPYYLDGLQVLVSTSENWDVFYSDTLMLYAEYISGTPLPGDSSFSNYTFSDGFIFGLDGEWVEFHADSMRFRGILRPDSASLAAYAGMDIYIAFCHGTTDDNWISLDDIKVTGDGAFVSVTDPEALSGGLHVFPNPASDVFTVEYVLPKTTSVTLNVYDESGRIVRSISNNMQVKGNYRFSVDGKDLPAGNYDVVLKTPAGVKTSKLTKI